MTEITICKAADFSHGILFSYMFLRTYEARVWHRYKGAATSLLIGWNHQGSYLKGL